MDTIQGNHFKDFLDTLFKRKVMILLFFFATVITAAIGTTFFQKIEYEAYSKVLIEANRGFVSDRSLPIDGPRRRSGGGLSMEQQVDLALQVLKDNELTTRVVNKIGPTVIYEDIEKPGLKKRLLLALGLRSPEDEKAVPVAEIASIRLQQRLFVVRTGRESSIINVGFRHKDPVVAANVVNSVVDLYVERHLGLRKKPRLTRFFQEQFVAKKATLAEAERDFQEFKDTWNLTSSPEDSIISLLELKKENQTQLDETVSQQAELVNRMRVLRHQLANTGRNPKTINPLQEKLVELQLKESELSIRYEALHPKMEILLTEIRQTEEKLAELGYKQTGSRSINNSSSLHGDLQEKLLQTELAVNSLRARKGALTVQLAEYNDQIRKLNGLEPEYQRHEDELSMARESYRLYQTKFEEFRISDALDAEGIANIKVLEIAHIPLSPIPSKTALILLLAIFFGAFGGIGIALFIELFSGTLKKKEDTEQHLKRPVLATIPEYEPSNDALPSIKREAAL
jgi:uncharacterized protein involved in exopolysaccharide biosynthesis